MDELMRLVSQVRDRFRGRVDVTLRPGVAFLYFGNNTGLEVRLSDGDRFDCTLLAPTEPVQTMQATSRVVLLMVDDLSHGKVEHCAQRGRHPQHRHAP